MKRLMRILAAVIVAAILTAGIIPSALAEGDPNYNGNDVAKIDAFLDQPSSVSGETNAQALDYAPDDPSTWTDVTWDTNGRVQTITWDSRSLAGSLDLSDCSSLEELYFYDNSITSFDVNGCSAIKYIDCSNNQIGSLNVTGLPSLELLDCSNNNLQGFTDFSGDTALTYLDCSGNKNLASINVSSLTSLEQLYCSGDNLALNLSGLNNLMILDCSDNYWLRSLNLTAKDTLIYLDCSGCGFSTLDMSGFTALQYLICSDNHNLGYGNGNEAPLKVAGLGALQYLDCSGNPYLSSLDLSGLSSLYILFAGSDDLASLDISGCGALEVLDCSYNSLSSLNAGGAANLAAVDVSGNGLNSLDITSSSLEYLDTSGNPLIHLGAIINGQPVTLTAAGSGYVGIYYDSQSGDAMATAYPVPPAELGSWTKSGAAVSSETDLNITSGGEYKANFVSSTQTGTVVNCTTVVNVRSGAGTNYSVLGTAPKGATYTVTGQSGSWYKIDFNGQTGYISSAYFSVSSSDNQNPPPSSQTGTVVNCTTGVNVRSGAGTSYSVLGTAPKGATYTVTGQSGSWYKIDYNGQTGYISSGYLSVS